MSTTDTRTAFETVLKIHRPRSDMMTMKKPDGSFEYWNNIDNYMWKSWQAALDWQAATEAVKATGTAGEQEPWQALDFGDVPFPGHWVASWPMAQQRGYIDGYRAATKDSAARQPAPALPERVRELECVIADLTRECKELRAALAATAAPVLSDEQIGEIADNFKFKDHWQSNAEAIRFAHAILAATRSQP